MDEDSRAEVSRIGIGLAAVGRPVYITAGRDRDLGADRDVDAMRRRTWQVLDAAYASGVRYVDAARSYGLAEEFLAGWLAERAAQRPPQATDVEVGSKWGYRYVGRWRLDAGVHEVKDHGVHAFTEQLRQTRALLGQRLSVYHVHSATPETGVLDDVALRAELAALRADGVRVGISTSGPGQADTIARALEIEVDGEPLFTSIQVTWNLLEPSAGPALAVAAGAGRRVIVKEAVANGRLAPGAGQAGSGERALARLAGGLDLPLDQLATAVALAQPWAWRVLSGGVTAQQVIGHVAAERVRLVGDVLEAALAHAEEPAAYWAARSRRAWS